MNNTFCMDTLQSSATKDIDRSERLERFDPLATRRALPLKPPKPEIQMSACMGQHQGDRKEQQDRVAIFSSPVVKNCVLGVLADGLGGLTGGSLAAENVILTTKQRFNSFDPAVETVASFFKSLVAEIHTVIRLTAITSGVEPHSTFAAMLVHPKGIAFCHVGDSRIYYFNGATIKHRTQDHTYAQSLIDRGVMSAEKAALHPSAQRLTNTLGGQKDPIPTIAELATPGPGDSYMLCSDGLWAYFSSGELGGVLSRLTARESAEVLIAQARERANKNGDNCSTVIFKFDRLA
jgi:PPM family protein phosphatase